MEHLIYNDFHPSEVARASEAAILSTDWLSHEAAKREHVLPATPWLGFDHDAMPLCSVAGYPTSAGFDKAQLWTAKLEMSHPDLRERPGKAVGRSVASMLQSWLYYGLLASVIGKPVRVSFLMRKIAAGEEALFSRNLHVCLQARVFELRTSFEDPAGMSRFIQEELRLVHVWMARFTTWSHPSFRPDLDKGYPGFMDRLEEVMPSIIRLAEAIEQTRLVALPHCETLGTLSWRPPFSYNEHRRELLRTLGWCNFQVQMLEDTLNGSTLDWLVATRKTQDRQGHEACTAKVCSRSNVDQDSYQQAHVHEGCQCRKLVPDIRVVHDMISSDRIPLMSLDISSTESKLMVSAASKADRGDYIAVSHVWADGIGGKAERGLNRCQVLRLHELCCSISTSEVPPRFWVDSLCIPSDKAVYKKALVGIRDVYKNAACVLVLDKSIVECTSISSSEDLYACIYMSAWMQRMWTYEEAVLARELVFRLKDGFHFYKVDTWPSMRRTVAVVFQSFATQLFRLRADSSRLNIGHVYMAFRYRLSNATQLEFVSVSGVLGLDPTELLETQGDDRVKNFWLLLRWVPFNVVFLDCPKLSKPGFRWAPKTLMCPSATKLDSEVEGAKSECTQHGLVGSYLLACLNRPLMGSSKGPGGISYVWLRGGDIEDPDHTPALLRIYCVEGWPVPPDKKPFDTIVFPDEARSIPGPGVMTAGAACVRRSGAEWEPRAARSGPVDVPIVELVGRVLIERLRDEELSSESPTIMFQGSSKVDVNANGFWNVSRVCIT